jgi:hypothetical protein
MKLSDREELRRRVEDLHRDHPDWYAKQIEAELGSRAPVAYGNWVEETPEPESRLRSIQRWRGGGLAIPTGPLTGTAFPYVWPIGERQREGFDPGFVPSKVPRLGSWRLFLHNCGPEVARDVRVTLDGHPVAYSPSLPTGRFSEIGWSKVEELRRAALTENAALEGDHELLVEFVIGKGMKEARLKGTLRFDPSQGWREFRAGDDRTSEIE